VLDSERVYPADGTWQCALVGSSQFTTCTRPTLEIGTSFAITLAARVKMGPGEAAATAQVTAANYPADIAAASDSITLDVLGSTYIPMLFTPLRQLPASEARNSTHIDQDREYPDAPMSWFVPGVRVWLADRASWQ
jgi:hypothetical protein